jgi:hypothetical protein
VGNTGLPRPAALEAACTAASAGTAACAGATGPVLPWALPAIAFMAVTVALVFSRVLGSWLSSVTAAAVPSAAALGAAWAFGWEVAAVASAVLAVIVKLAAARVFWALRMRGGHAEPGSGA